LDILPVPLKLKVGQLGLLDIQLEWSKKQMIKSITIKDVFLCFDMLDVNEWSEENVKQKY